MFKKLLNISDRTSGLLPKIEKVARLIAFLVLALDTLRFFKNGLEKLESTTDKKENETESKITNVSVGLSRGSTDAVADYDETTIQQ
jgi:hypothetical protein